MKVHQGEETTVSMIGLTGFQFHESEASKLKREKDKKVSLTRTTTASLKKSKQRRNAEIVNVDTSKITKSDKMHNNQKVVAESGSVSEESRWTKELLGKLSSVLHEALFKEHQNAWHELWKVGWSILFLCFKFILLYMLWLLCFLTTSTLN